MLKKFLSLKLCVWPHDTSISHKLFVFHRQPPQVSIKYSDLCVKKPGSDEISINDMATHVREADSEENLKKLI
jgi:hypothetical protein